MITLHDGATIAANTNGDGAGGELFVAARERLLLSGLGDDGRGASFQAMATAAGEAGVINVQAPLIELTDGASMRVTTQGAGAGGELIVAAGERLTLSGVDGDGLGSRLQANAEAEGNAGVIRLQAPLIEVLDGAAIQTNTSGNSEGNGGQLVVSAADDLVLAGNDGFGFGSSLQALTDGKGDGGTVHIEAAAIELRDGAFVSARTSQAGSSGLGGVAVTRGTAAQDEQAEALILKASERISLSGTDQHGQGSRIETTARESGDGRSIYLEAPVISLSHGATITSASEGTRSAGDISIAAKDQLLLTGGSTIVSTGGNVSGGDITVHSGRFLHMRDSAISTDTRSGSGEGGDINIVDHELVVMEGSRITATADAGRGGNIRIVADGIVRSSDSVIDASANTGIDGGVVTEAPETNDLARSSLSFLGDMPELRRTCEARAAQGDVGTFSVAQQRGLPVSPEELLLAFEPSLAIPAQSDYLSKAHVSGEALRGVALKQQIEGDYGGSLKTLDALVTGQHAQQQIAPATLGQLANAYLALGKEAVALDYFNKAIEATDSDDDAILAVLFNNLGNLYWLQNRNDKALSAYYASAQRAQLAGDSTQQAKALSNAARAALKTERLEQALALFDEVSVLSQQLSKSQSKAELLIHLAKLAQALGEAAPETKPNMLAMAYSELRMAVHLSRELGDPLNLSYALGNLSILYQQEQRVEEALYLTQLAQQAAERANAPESLYRWLWQAGQLWWAIGERDVALEAYRQAVTLLEASRPESRNQYGDAQQRFRQLVAPVYMELVDRLLQRAVDVNVVETGGLLREAQLTMERLKAAELRDYFRDECITELEAKNTRLDAVSPTAAVVYPILLPDRLELLISLPGGLRRYTVPVVAEAVNDAIFAFRKHVETLAPEQHVRAAGYKLYRWFVEPYAADLVDTDTLVFVPSGRLRTVPLAALYDGEDYLIRRYRVVVTPGLALTDPKPFNRNEANVVLAGISEAVQEFPALPAVTSELKAVRQLFGGRLLLDKNFTLATFEQALARPVSVVHIASHAQFTGDPNSSFLLTHDGRLSMESLENALAVTRFRDKPLELLVLSACQTAAGDERAALGLAGVGIQAGARSALGSLWSINDTATASLITAFYHHLKIPGTSRAQALQQAQSEILTGDPFSHPFYWSGFLMINNWL